MDRMKKPLSRRTAAVLTAAAMVSGSFPGAALAQPGQAATAGAVSGTPGQTSSVTPAQAMAQFRAWGIIKGDSDVLKSYLGNDKDLTPIGKALYDSLAPRYNPADAAAALQPTFDALRAKGPYTPQSAQNSAKLVKQVNAQLNDILAGGAGGDAEDTARSGAQMQAALSGAAVADPPKLTDMRQVRTPTGYDFFDSKGLAYEINEHNATVYNRELQQNQHKMNQHPQPGAPFVPETGRYNNETFQYSYVAIKNQYDQLYDGMRRDRMIALAELLGKSGQFRDDMWFTDKTLEADLIAQAKKTTYRSGERVYSVWDIVESHFRQREASLKQAQAAVARYNTDMDSLIRSLRGNPVIGDAAVKSLTMDEQGGRVALTRVVLETQSYYIRSQKERLDPASPDSKALMDALDQIGLSADLKAKYMKAGRDMIARLSQTQLRLDKVRGLLDKLDPAASLDAANAILTATQSQLGDVSTDYSVYVEAASVAALAKQQTKLGWIDKGASLVSRAFGGQGSSMPWEYATVGLFNHGYQSNMDGIVAARPKYLQIMTQIANGDMAGARKTVIAMNPNAASQHFSAALFGDNPARVTDDVKIAASLKANRDQIVSVFETNKWIDMTSSLIEWSVAIGLGGGIASNALKGLGDSAWVAGLAKFQAAEDAGMAARMGASMLRGTGMLIRETSLHTAARLSTLQTERSLEMTSQIKPAAVRYLAESGVRAMNAAARQGTFTLMSGTISGGFMLSEQLIGNRPFLTGGINVAGHQILDPAGHTMYTADAAGAGEAFLAGAKGGAWWANESWHPMLNYAGLPSTVFTGTWMSRGMDVLGARGAVDSAYSALGGLASWVMPTAVKLAGEDSALASVMTRTTGALWPVAEGGASKGLLDRLGEQGAIGKAAAIPLSMADNVVKYALVSGGASLVGNAVAYYAPSVDAPVFIEGKTLPVMRQVTWGSEDDIERRIKGANQTGSLMMNAPIWLALPTYSANQALEAQSMGNAVEGMRQYDEAGQTWKYANAEPGTQLGFIETPRTPISQRVFDFHFFRDPPHGKWTVTQQVKDVGVEKEMVRSIGGKNATPATVNPLEFLRISRLGGEDQFINLKINDSVRLAAYRNFIRALITNPERALKILNAKPGERVEGVGRVTPEIKRDVAVALYSADVQIGRPMPRSLSPAVEKILKPFLDANLQTREPAVKLARTLESFKPSEKFLGKDGALAKIREEIADWRENRASTGVTYKQLVVELREQARQMTAGGEISAHEGEVLAMLYDYVDALDKRFNSFNTVERAYALADESMSALSQEFGSRRAPQDLLARYKKRLDDWGKNPADPNAPAFRDGAESEYAKIIKDFRAELEKNKTETNPQKKLTDGERQALSKAVSDMEAAPWAVRDFKGTAIKGWNPAQPQQFEALMGALTGFIERRPGGSVRVFQLLKTGGGKTLVALEGLLPLIEADASMRNKKIVYLTSQSNLEAQARMDFISFKKIGSNISFETYGTLKGKIAEGKLKAKNVQRESWFFGDEFDAAGLDAATSMGQTTGRITKLNGFYTRIEGLDQAVGAQIEDAASSRGVDMQTEARVARHAVSQIDAPGADALRAELNVLDEAAGRYAEADGPLARFDAEADVRASAGRVGGLLDIAGADSDALSTARASLGRLQKILENPPNDASFRDGVAAQLRQTLLREDRLLALSQDEGGLRGLVQEADARSAKLGDRINALTLEATAAERSTGPGAAARARALRAEIDLAIGQKAMTDRFPATDAGTRLSGLQDKIAGAEDLPADQRPAAFPQWKSEATDIMAKLPAEARAVAEARSASLAKQYEIGRRSSALVDQAIAAKGEGRPTADLELARQALESEYSSAQAESMRLRRVLSAGSADGDLGAMVKSIETLPGESRERERLADRARGEARRQFADAGEEILRIVRQGGQGWEDRAVRLLEQRRALIKSFAGEENPMYTGFRHMNQDMERFASGLLRSQEPEKYRAGQRLLDKMVDGQKLTFLENAQMLWSALRGRPIDLPISKLGLTRARAAEMLKALYREPSAPGLQADGMFWKLTGSLLFPRGFGGRSGAWLTPEELKSLEASGTRFEGEGSSWVRTEMMRQLKGFFEDPAGIRNDNRTERINVVHNGQWFESMDNETRRYWELAYGTDLTMPYTHQAMSTIKDLTTDQETNFIAFSGTAGETLTKHYTDNNILTLGEGSRGQDETVALTPRPTDSFGRVDASFADLNSSRGEAVIPELRDAPLELKAALVDRADGALPTSVTLKLDDFRDVEREPSLDWLRRNAQRRPDGSFSLDNVKGAPESVRRAALEALNGSQPAAPRELKATLVEKADGSLPRPVTLRLDSFTNAAREKALAWLEQNGRPQGDGLVSLESVKGAPEDVRLAALDAMTGQLSVRIQDVADFAAKSLKDGSPRAGQYELGLAQLRDMRAATGDADGVLIRLKSDGAVPADAMPPDVKPAIDRYLAERKLSGGSAVIRISEVKGDTDAQTAAAQRWLRDVRKTVEISVEPPAQGQLKPEAYEAEMRARRALEPQLAQARQRGDKSLKLRVSELPFDGKISAADAEAARAWLREQPDAQESGLMVLSVSDTRALKMVRQYLMRVKGLQADEIAMVFSDTEYLRNNVPEAQVQKQMNLEGLNTGRVRVLILDTRVGGRGLDLNFKGERNNASPTAFRGYTDFDMLIVDPHKMSKVHLLQAEGRIDLGRVLPNASRDFSLVMDIASVEKYSVFQDMIATNPFFGRLRADPRFTAFMKARGGQPDWAAYDAYVRLRAAEGGDEGAALAEDYAQVVKDALKAQQLKVETGQLQSSQVLQDGKPVTNGLYPGIEGLR